MNYFTTKKGTRLPLLDLKGKDYLQVCWRVVWFREEFPLGRIDTERVAEGEDFVTYRATISIPDGATYVKLANADKTGKIKTTLDYEKIETGAIGRALALSGFGTSNSADDLDEGEHLSDSPQPPKKPETAFKGPVGGTAPTKPLPKTTPPPKKIEQKNPEIPDDQVFLIGKEIKGKRFSEKIGDKNFLKWVNEVLSREDEKPHPQILEFHKYARAHGAYKMG